MPIVIDESTFYASIIGLIILSRIISSQGGLKITLWRIWGVKWFMRTEKQADGNAVRTPLKMKILKTRSRPTYTFHGKDWFTGGPTETARVYGAPNWVYNYNDSRPLPLEHDGEPIDPTLIHAAFENQSIEAFNHLGQPRSKKAGVAMALMFVVIIIMLLTIWFYTYYYGLNVNCAVHSQACPK